MPVASTQVHPVLASVLEVSVPSLSRGVTIWFDPLRAECVLHDLVGSATRYGNRASIVVTARRWTPTTAW